MHDARLERLILFSDAVFAIAITLLVIEIHVPHLHPGAPWQEGVNALLALIPQFIGYVVSFLVIGSFWAFHHRMFGMLARHDQSFIWPNIHLLMLIAFLPFSTAFMSENVWDVVPHAFYSLSLIAAGLLQMRLGRRVLDRRFALPETPPEDLVRLRRRLVGLPAAAAIAFLVSLVAPFYSNFALILIPVFIGIQTRRPVTEADLAKL